MPLTGRWTQVHCLLMRATEFIAQVSGGQPAPAYFLRGPDRFLLEECREAVLTAVPPGARTWCLIGIEFEPGRLGRDLEQADQMPMLGGRSFLLFSDPEDFRRAEDQDYEALERYLEKPSPFATLVFAAAEPDRRRRFAQLLEKKAAVVELMPLDRHEAAKWLAQYLRRAGVAIAPELAAQAAARFENHPDPRSGAKPGVNLLWLRTEAAKLLTARPGAKRWEEADLNQMVSSREEHEIAKVLEAIAERDAPRALERLRALLASKEPETLILWSIGDLFRQALKSGPAASHSRGGWYRPAGRSSTFEIAERAAHRYSPQELAQALRHTHDIDLALKSSWKDSRVLLEILIWRVTAGKGASSVDARGIGPLSD
jgi:DNA polymerase III delta subunit